MLDCGVRSLAVVLKHSAIFPDHERLVGEVARGMGFSQISLSSAVMPMVKMVPRGFTASADAYLTPHIMRREPLSPPLELERMPTRLARPPSPPTRPLARLPAYLPAYHTAVLSFPILQVH